MTKGKKVQRKDRRWVDLAGLVRAGSNQYRRDTVAAAVAAEALAQEGYRPIEVSAVLGVQGFGRTDC